MGFFVILLAMNMGPKAVPVQGGVKGQHGGGFPADEEKAGPTLVKPKAAKAASKKTASKRKSA